MMRQSIRFSAVLLALLALSACGKGDATHSGQVVAKVNGEEITIHQVNAAMARFGKLDETQAKEASQKVLNSLIDQQLLLKKAAEKKLERDPAVMQALEGAKRQVLSQAYLEKMMQSVGKPSASEVHDYYAQHPGLFENRRIYKFQEILLENSNPEALKAAKEKLDQGKGLGDFVKWLRTENIAFKADETVKPAEKFPMEMLLRVQSLKVGQMAMVSSDQGALILNLVAARDQPVTEAQAKPAIEAFLTNKKRSEYAQAEIKKMHDAAQIEYLGAFASAGKLAQTESAAAKAADGAIVAPSAKPAAPAKSDRDALEKGLSGLN